MAVEKLSSDANVGAGRLAKMAAKKRKKAKKKAAPKKKAKKKASRKKRA